MNICELSRAEFYDQTTGFESDRSANYPACNLTKEEAKRELKPELLDGHPALSSLEGLCFEEVWSRFSQGGSGGWPVYWQSLGVRYSLTLSYRRLYRRDFTSQYVEVRFAEDVFQKNWHLTPEEEERVRGEIVDLIRKTFQFDGEGTLPDLIIDDKPPPNSEQATIVWVGDRDLFQRLTKEPSAIRTGFLVAMALGIGSVDIQAEQVRRLRQKYGMPDEPIDRVLEKEYESKRHYTIGDGMCSGEAFWRSFDYYLSPYGSEFGNATPNGECFIAVYRLLLASTEKGISGKALTQLVEGAAKTAVHELGHAFGIAHNTVGDSVMRQGAPTFEFDEGEKEYLRQIFGHRPTQN